MYKTGINYLKTVYTKYTPDEKISFESLLSCLFEIPKSYSNKYAVYTVLITFLYELDILLDTKEKLKKEILKKF